jgi:RND superfamily putative drug exporter
MLGALGDFVYRRRRQVLLAWAILFVVGIAVGGGVFNHLKDSNGAGSSESVQGAQLLEDANSTSASLVAVVNGKPVDDPATRAAVVRASRSVPRCRMSPRSSTPTATATLGCAPRTATRA